jgi:hypothetical protein
MQHRTQITIFCMLPGTWSVYYRVEAFLPVERSRTEISIPAHLMAWKSMDAGCLYVISRCEGVSQFTFGSMDVVSCEESISIAIIMVDTRWRQA